MTMTSSIRGLLCSTAIVCSMIGRPAILISCFGMLSPTRAPTPPARTTATLRNELTGRGYRVNPAVTTAPAGEPSAGVEQVEDRFGEVASRLTPRILVADEASPHRRPGRGERVCPDKLVKDRVEVGQVRCDHIGGLGHRMLFPEQLHRPGRDDCHR